jgi:hypothetical protein
MTRMGRMGTDKSGGGIRLRRDKGGMEREWDEWDQWGQWDL